MCRGKSDMAWHSKHSCKRPLRDYQGEKPSIYTCRRVNHRAGAAHAINTHALNPLKRVNALTRCVSSPNHFMMRSQHSEIMIRRSVRRIVKRMAASKHVASERHDTRKNKTEHMPTATSRHKATGISKSMVSWGLPPSFYVHVCFKGGTENSPLRQAKPGSDDPYINTQ